MTRREQIRSAYRLTGGNAGFYDGMMTYSTLPGKAICRIVWNMDREKNIDYLERALSGVSEGFSGRLLEVPVGTGVLTMPVYRDLPGADITCLDYSEDMMASARARAQAARLQNVRFMQGDVGALPFGDEQFDIVLSLALMPGALVIGAWDGIRNSFGFRQFFLRFVVMLLGLKAFDIGFFDWFLLCNAGMNFFPHFYPETKAVLGHHLFGYNWKTHLAHIIATFPVSALLAWICSLFSGQYEGNGAGCVRAVLSAIHRSSADGGL